jgi:hypothetical protein
MRLAPWLCALLLGACGEPRVSCDDLPDIIRSPAGLELVPADDHPGWGQERCMSCHSQERMHLRNCTGIPEVDVAAIRAIVDEQGEEACAACHGDNGVQP